MRCLVICKRFLINIVYSTILSSRLLAAFYRKLNPKRSKQNGIWDQKDPVLKGFLPKKVVLVLVDEEKYPRKIVFNTQKVKKVGQNGSTYVSPTYGTTYQTYQLIVFWFDILHAHNIWAVLWHWYRFTFEYCHLPYFIMLQSRSRAGPEPRSSVCPAWLRTVTWSQDVAIWTTC